MSTNVPPGTLKALCQQSGSLSLYVFWIHLNTWKNDLNSISPYVKLMSLKPFSLRSLRLSAYENVERKVKMMSN